MPCPKVGAKSKILNFITNVFPATIQPYDCLEPTAKPDTDVPCTQSFINIIIREWVPHGPLITRRFK